MGKMDSLVKGRCTIYLFGGILWGIFTVKLPTLVQEPASSPIVPMTSLIGYFLLGANFFSTLLRNKEYPNYDGDKKNPENIERYKAEGRRLDVVQKTGYYVILPASVTAGITAHSSRLLLAYLGASITIGVVALVPIWASTTDWRNVIVLRHIKSVMLIWAMTWLVEGVVALLSANLPPP